MKKKPSPYHGYFLLLLAGAMFCLGSYFKTPLIAEHRLLVAEAASKNDPFYHAVILVTVHNRAGASGFVLNKGNNGGPVNRERITVLHSNDAALPGSTIINGIGVGIAEGAEQAEALRALNPKPKWSEVLNGYAGWGPGQLEDEIQAGSWKVVRYDQKTVMDTEPARMWAAARKLPALKEE